MLSLPEDWDYTTKGLARICKDGIDSICAGVRELEEQGYVVRERIRNENGQLGSIEYTILEQPRSVEPKPGKPKLEKPILDKPVLGKPEQENPAQLNTYRLNKDLSSIEQSNPIPSSPHTPTAGVRGVVYSAHTPSGRLAVVEQKDDYSNLIPLSDRVIDLVSP